MSGTDFEAFISKYPEMNQYQFNALNEKEQINVLASKGSRLGSRRETGMLITLYQLSEFYVEVLFDQQKQKVTGLRSFGTAELPQVYLDDIDLSTLTN